MERKTIGSFIATLRKANGMTQKELAERLNVSDKSVSRWERDETAPDLSLIPVIAEIFNVTTDELLRGERNPQSSETEPVSKKSEKQIKNILNQIMARYKSMSLISIGISTVGFIAAMLCNFAFLRANIGFYVAVIFFAAALVVQGIFTVNAKTAVDSDEFENTEKSKINSILLMVCTYTAVLFAAVLPLVTLVDDPYCGIGYDFIGYSFQYALVPLIVGLAVLLFNQRGKINKKFALKCLLGTVIAIAVTGILFFAESRVIESNAVHMTFDTPQDFIAFMETKPDNSESYIEISEDGSERISDDWGFKDSITWADGKEYEFINRNPSVTMIEYEDGTMRVYTEEQLNDLNRKQKNLKTAFLIVCIAEILAAAIVYFKKNKANG